MKAYAFIDASNLTYGGEKSLGWSVDYRKLRDYLKDKYGVTQIFFFGGVDAHHFRHDYLKDDTVPLTKLERYLNGRVRNHADEYNDAELAILARHIRRVRFYKRLKRFGYELALKPVKEFIDDDGKRRRKGDCDVDMTLALLSKANEFDRAVVISGDGDFLPVLKHLRNNLKKEVLILARGPKTARELKQFAGSEFRDFVRLQHELEFKRK